jgi:hypothetical protein
MANIKSFPNNQDEYIGAEYVMKWLHGRTSGVFAAEGNASVSALLDSAMAVTISDGLGWMANAGKDGVVWWIDNEATNGTKLRLNIDPADGTKNRIDRIIVEWKTTNYVDYPEVKVLKGTISSKATAPALTNDNTVRQISLARINIAAGTTAITPSMITDERLDASVCGLVTENIVIDTSVVNAQFQEFLEQIKTNLKNVTEEQFLDKSISVRKLAEETLKYINAENICDNSDFTRFIAQIGIGGLHGKQAYAGDRWILDSGFVSGEANANGEGYTNVVLNGTIRQIVANPPDVCTAAVEMVSGTAEISYENGEITITSSGGVIKNVRLFNGEYTDDNIPAYRARRYSVELAECQRYFIYFDDQVIMFGDRPSSKVLNIAAHLPCEMRTSPTVLAMPEASVIRGGGKGYSASELDLKSCTVSKQSGNCVRLETVWGNSFPSGYIYEVILKKLQISADL